MLVESSQENQLNITAKQIDVSMTPSWADNLLNEFSVASHFVQNDVIYQVVSAQFIESLGECCLLVKKVGSDCDSMFFVYLDRDFVPNLMKCL